MKEYIYDEVGYQKLLDKMKELQKKHDVNSLQLAKSFQDATGDGAHDNSEFETLLTNERLIVSQMQFLQNQLDSAKIIKTKKLPNNVVNINDTIKIGFVLDSEELDIDTFKLVGGDSQEKNEISINSPLGKALYEQKVGSKITYMVNDNPLNVIIVEKIS